MELSGCLAAFACLGICGLTVAAMIRISIMADNCRMRNQDKLDQMKRMKEEPKQKWLATPLVKPHHIQISGGLALAASLLLMISFSVTSVKVVNCGAEDSVTRAIKKNAPVVATMIATVPCPCGCGCNK